MSQIKGAFIAAVILLPALTARAEGGAALFGAAAIASAITPMAVSGIQAGADVKIAGIQSDVARYQVDRYADSSEYQALLASQTQIALAGLQYAANGFNQQMTTERLQMQLDSMQRASELRRQLDSERLHQKYSLLNRQLDLQAKQMDQSFQLQKNANGSIPLFLERNTGKQVFTRHTGIAKAKAKKAVNRLLSTIKTQPIRVSGRPLPSRVGTSLSQISNSTASTSRVATTAGYRDSLVNPRSRRAAVGEYPRHQVRGVGGEALERRGHGASSDSDSVVRVGR